MPPGTGDRLDELGPQPGAQRLGLLVGDGTQIIAFLGRVDTTASKRMGAQPQMNIPAIPTATPSRPPMSTWKGV